MSSEYDMETIDNGRKKTCDKIFPVLEFKCAFLGGDRICNYRRIS